MQPENTLLIAFCFFLVAGAYSTVGHAGASGYLAIMALLSFGPIEMKTVSLLLNIIVSAITAYQFLKAGYFNRKIFFSFSILSIPMAYLGGNILLEESYFKILAASFLLLSAVYLIVKNILNISLPLSPYPMPFWAMIPTGGVIGFISGLIGVGGGIFLSPILLVFSSLSPKTVGGISALFIFVNSILGFVGHSRSLEFIPYNTVHWIIAVILGGLIGSYLGTKKFSNKAIFILLSVILLSAGLKMLFA